jgi:hypothetical protein
MEVEHVAKKWEYRIVDAKDIPGRMPGKDREDVENYLNELGNDGWEMFALHFRHPELRYEFFGIARRELSQQQGA